MVRIPGVRSWNQCLKSCFIIIWQLLPPLSSQPRVHKWAGSTTGWVLMWNGTVVRTPCVRPGNQCLKSCFIIIWQLLPPLSSQPRVHKWAGSHNGMGPDVERHSGADTWCPAMEPMSQIMFYNHLATFATIVKSAKGPQVGRFHNGMGPDVERGQLCRHLVPGHETNVSNHVL